ncbi:MAG: hypothetical protein MUE36_12000 [Acidimicrobiales bacterium]|jgi:hypothetical protein|nr:hypothetical protein [Acidimicrobiales bacterium]
MSAPRRPGVRGLASAAVAIVLVVAVAAVRRRIMEHNHASFTAVYGGRDAR